MRKFFIFLLPVALIGIFFNSKKAKKPTNKVTQQKVNTTPKSKQQNINYDSCLATLHKQKKQLYAKWQNTSNTQKQQFFTNQIVNTVIPAWYGTAWNFNGITQIPKQGTIACGYFVTTVLKHAGVPINRVRMAQAPAEEFITTIISPQNITRSSNQNYVSFCQQVQNAGYGLYILGLDNHVGFVYNDGTNSFFIHAYYLNNIGVIKEPLQNSNAVKYSKYRVIGALSKQNNILNQFILN
jgi:hypothetical protein